jgi:DNA-binding transcriptional LysR family regulator
VDLRQLRLFLAVAEEGNFTRAAEQVNLSQPALTHRIRGLEDELGVLLFTRTARGASLTPAGEVLLEDARHLLDYAALSVQRVRRAGGMTENAVRVGFDFVEFGGVPPLPSLLTAFRERFPEAQVSIQTLAGEELERALLEERLDIGFALGPPSRQELGFHALLEGAYQVLVPVGHPLAQFEQVSCSDLLRERLLLPRLSVRDDATLLAYLRGEGLEPKVVYKGAEVAAFDGLLAAGEGVAVLPSGIVSSVGVNRAVRALAGAPSWSFGLMWRTEQPLPIADLGQRLIRQLVPRAVMIDGV